MLFKKSYNLPFGRDGQKTQGQSDQKLLFFLFFSKNDIKTLFEWWNQETFNFWNKHFFCQFKRVSNTPVCNFWLRPARKLILTAFFICSCGKDTGTRTKSFHEKFRKIKKKNCIKISNKIFFKKIFLSPLKKRISGFFVLNWKSRKIFPEIREPEKSHPEANSAKDDLVVHIYREVGLVFIKFRLLIRLLDGIFWGSLIPVGFLGESLSRIGIGISKMVDSFL